MYVLCDFMITHILVVQTQSESQCSIQHCYNLCKVSLWSQSNNLYMYQYQCRSLRLCSIWCVEFDCLVIVWLQEHRACGFKSIALCGRFSRLLLLARNQHSATSCKTRALFLWCQCSFQHCCEVARCSCSCLLETQKKRRRGKNVWRGRVVSHESWVNESWSICLFELVTSITSLIELPPCGEANDSTRTSAKHGRAMLSEICWCTRVPAHWMWADADGHEILGWKCSLMAGQWYSMEMEWMDNGQWIMDIYV